MNTRKFWMLSIVAAGLFLAALSLATPTWGQELKLSGAIFTTLVDGTRVNANIYPSKEDVYLDGGPGPNAPSQAAGLPEGCYYFQVTDPSGKVLLSTDPVKCRRFHVNADGVIDGVCEAMMTQRVKGQLVDVDCSHNTGIDTDHAELGAITVQLMPYDNTPNNGGVYKVWVTLVGEFVGNPDEVDNPEFFHGFVPRFSKTDNFKVKGRAPLIPITVRKFHDKNANGVWDKDLFVDENDNGIWDPDEEAYEKEITGWGFSVTDPLGASNDPYTPATVWVTAGTWTVTEDEPDGTLVTASFVDGVASDPPAATVCVTVGGTAGETHEVIFGNVGLGEISVSPKFYDHDGDGLRDPDEPALEGFRFELTGPGGYDVVTATDVNGYAAFVDLLPGEYTLSEIAPSPDWVTPGPIVIVVESNLDLTGRTVIGTQWAESIGNYRVDHADFDTKGYWHNKNGLAELTDDDIAYVNDLLPYCAPSSYFGAGDEPFDEFFFDGNPVAAAFNDDEPIWAGGTWQAEVSQFLVDANAGGDPREQLAQQLLAFIFNCRHRLDCPDAAIQLPDGSCVSASVLIAEAIAAWSSGDGAAATAMASLLDSLNNDDDVPFICFYPCPIVYAP